MKRLCTLFAIMITVSACAPPPATAPAPTDTLGPAANLPNPASVFCEQQGRRLEIRTAADASQSGVCVFAEGGECDE